MAVVGADGIGGARAAHREREACGPLRSGVARSAVPLLAWERRTALVGLVATAVAFGPARMAFGMLLPPMREAFGVSAGAAGAAVSAGFAGFVAALLLTSWITRRQGPKLPVILGGALAAIGCAAVALAPSAAVMLTGTVVAAAAGGFAWTPYNAIAQRLVRAPQRDDVLSAVSTGTTLGVIAMALGAFAVAMLGLHWRWVWGASAIVAALSTAAAFALLPPAMRLRPRTPPAPAPRADLRALAAPAAMPLYAGAFVFGAVSATVSTFAVEHAATGTAGPATWIGATLFLGYGVLGIAGFATARAERLLGLPVLSAACFALAALSCALLGLWTPGLPRALPIAGGALFGVVGMVFSVVIAVRSMRLFPDMPVTGFTAAIAVGSLGSMIGPMAAGALAEGVGLGTAFLAAALLCAGAAAAFALRHPQSAASGGCTPASS